MDAVTIVAAIAAISAAVVLATGIVSSGRADSTGKPKSIESVPADPQDRERGDAHRGPDYARITQLVALAFLIVAVIVLIIMWI